MGVVCRFSPLNVSCVLMEEDTMASLRLSFLSRSHFWSQVPRAATDCFPLMLSGLS